MPAEKLFKGYLCYNAITSQNVPSEPQIKYFFIPVFSISNHPTNFKVCEVQIITHYIIKPGPLIDIILSGNI